MSEDAEARARALALLEATHSFPCQYAVTVIAFNRDEVARAVRDAAWPAGGGGNGAGEVEQEVGDVRGLQREGGEGAPPLHETKASSGGRYVSHRLSVFVGSAAEVLALYARFRSVDGVITVM
jgi:putative lipoic acid-binding regulatory protein